MDVMVTLHGDEAVKYIEWVKQEDRLLEAASSEPKEEPKPKKKKPPKKPALEWKDVTPVLRKLYKHMTEALGDETEAKAAIEEIFKSSDMEIEDMADVPKKHYRGVIKLAEEKMNE